MDITLTVRKTLSALTGSRPQQYRQKDADNAFAIGSCRRMHACVQSGGEYSENI